MAALLIAACQEGAARKKAAAPPVAAVPAPALHTLPAPSEYPAASKAEIPQFDPVKETIGHAEDLYRLGEDDFHQGHLDRAKRSFDRSVEALLHSPVPIESDERLQKEFESLVDRIHQYELLALKQGDGFTDQKYTAAPLDEILSVETFPPKIDEKLRAAAEKEVTEVSHDLPIVVNAQVLNYLDYFTHGRGRATMESGLRRIGMYRPMIERILKQTGVPADLIYLAQIESGYQPLALSNKKCRGLWQFAAWRGAEYGLTQNWWVDERQDPEKSTRAAARHLKDLHDQFQDWLLAMAAYDTGPGNIQRAIERTGYADYWKMRERHVLIQETENYIPAILATMIIGKNPKQYGFDVDPLPPIETERVTISTPTDLRLIAETIDVPLETLESLNPQLLRMTTPPNQPDFQINLPKGTKEKFLTEIAAIPEDKRVLWRQHKITEGESLSTIARNYHTTVAAIEQVNNLERVSVLEEGTKIIIPSTPSAKKTLVKHRVERGETLASIANKYDVTPTEIRKWNHLGVKSAARRGQRLTIYVASTRAVGAIAERNPRSLPPARALVARKLRKGQAPSSVVHNVKRGETLASIATSYKTTVNSLMHLNGISDARQLRAGEKIRIHAEQ